MILRGILVLLLFPLPALGSSVTWSGSGRVGASVYPAGFYVHGPAGLTTSGAATGSPLCQVTSLDGNSLTAGTFEYAVETCAASGGRVEFTVSGTIFQTRNVNIPSDVTIDGSTAPDQGVVIAGTGLIEATGDNIVIRNMRFVAIGDEVVERDCLNVSGSNIVVDHSLFVGCTDGLLDVASSVGLTTHRANVTVQYSVIAWPAYQRMPGTVSGGSLISGHISGVTWWRNVIATTSDRGWLVHLSSDDVQPAHMVVESVFYDVWRMISATMVPVDGLMLVDLVRNVHKLGPATDGRPSPRKPNLARNNASNGSVVIYGTGTSMIDGGGDLWSNYHSFTDERSHSGLYGSGDPILALGSCLSGADPPDGLCGNFAQAPAITHLYPVPGPLSGSSLVSHLLANAGPREPCADALTNQILGDVENGTRTHGWVSTLGAPPIPDVSQECAVQQFVPACGDKIDNEGDGLIDYPADPDCGSIAGTSEGVIVATACLLDTCQLDTGELQ